MSLYCDLNLVHPFISGFASYAALRMLEGKCSFKDCNLQPIVQCEKCKVTLCAYHANQYNYRCPKCNGLLSEFKSKEEKLLESFLRRFSFSESSD